MADLKPVYLIHGDDHGAVAERRAGLRTLADSAQDGGTGAEILENDQATPAGVAAALAAMTLAVGRRVIIVEGAERWRQADIEKELAPALAQMPPQEQVTILELPPVSPHWIATASFGGSIMVTPITLVDGDSLKVIGTITGGLTAMFAASPDHKQFYTADTFYSRAIRGDRTDTVTISQPLAAISRPTGISFLASAIINAKAPSATVSSA